MSRGTWNIDYGPLRGFYRDRENGWVFGVCAGLADRFNFRVGTVRVIAIISLLLFLYLLLLLLFFLNYFLLLVFLLFFTSPIR